MQPGTPKFFLTHTKELTLPLGAYVQFLLRISELHLFGGAVLLSGIVVYFILGIMASINLACFALGVGGTLTSLSRCGFDSRKRTLDPAEDFSLVNSILFH